MVPEDYGEGVFSCINGKCIDQRAICDGSYDCEDGSDEDMTTCGGEDTGTIEKLYLSNIINSSSIIE